MHQDRGMRSASKRRSSSGKRCQSAVSSVMGQFGCIKPLIVAQLTSNILDDTRAALWVTATTETRYDRTH